MAIAGGATTAYKLRLVDGKPVPERTTKLAYLCISPEGAVTMLRTGGSPTVQGSDMAAFWQLWGGVN